MYKQIGKYSRHISWLYLFLGGLLAGILIINIWRNLFLGEMELLSAASVSRLKYLEVDGKAFLFYILRERLGTIILLCLLAVTYIGTIAVSLYAVWTGMMAGVFLSVAAMRYGIKGIFLILAGILPQYILLVPACIMLMNWCYFLCVFLYFPNKNHDNEYETKKQFYIKKILQLFIILGVVIIGSIMESYVNPILLSNYLKLF